MVYKPYCKSRCDIYCEIWQIKKTAIICVNQYLLPSGHAKLGAHGIHTIFNRHDYPLTAGARISPRFLTLRKIPDFSPRGMSGGNIKPCRASAR